jgi:dihydrofolate reductase
MYSIIVATDSQNGIAKENAIPWTLKKDLQFFKDTTTNCPEGTQNIVVMGRKTFESMGHKLLPNRMNIILTRQEGYTVEGAHVFLSLEKAIEFIQTVQNKYRVFVIGGQDIYEEALNKLDIQDIYKTILTNSFQCDRFFPDISTRFIFKEQLFAHSELGQSYSVQYWVKKE